MRLLVDARWGNWLGGINYSYNIVYSLLSYTEKVSFSDLEVIIVLDSKKNIGLFKKLIEKSNKVTVVVWRENEYRKIIKKIKKEMNRYIFHRSICYHWSDGIIECIKPDVVFPSNHDDERYRNVSSIAWIPDFQYAHFPELFPGDVLNAYKNNAMEVAQLHNKLILSSQSVYKDYISLFPNCTRGVHIVPFASCIDDSLLEKRDFTVISDRYGLPHKYFVVANQFWRHKNHKMVFEAIAQLKDECDIRVVCTGLLDDGRDKTYSTEIRKLIYEKGIEDNVILTGIVDREEQLLIMKNSLAIIQPSLFEGWSTVVEDAKTLHIPIVLSDISVHLEQTDNNMFFYDKNNIKELIEILYGIWEGEINICQNLDYDFDEYAKEYGKRFFEVIMECKEC